MKPKLHPVWIFVIAPLTGAIWFGIIKLMGGDARLCWIAAILIALAVMFIGCVCTVSAEETK